jgi:enoyl-CoA hydratase/carnithine racemase
MTPTMTGPATKDFPELQTLSFEVAETGLGVLRVNPPERMNSQTVRMFTEYGLVARALRDSRLRALILTGAGERAFCAGDESVALARLIATNSPGGVRMSKRAIQRNQEITSYAAALELENRGQALLTQSADMPEALAAFKEKRAPRYTGK